VVRPSHKERLFLVKGEPPPPLRATAATTTGACVLIKLKTKKSGRSVGSKCRKEGGIERERERGGDGANEESDCRKLGE